MLVELQCSGNNCLKYHEKVTTGSVSEKISLKHHPKNGKVFFYDVVKDWLQTWNLIKPWSWVSNLLSYRFSGGKKSSRMSQTNSPIQSGKDLPSLRRLQKCCFLPLNSFPGGIPLFFPLNSFPGSVPLHCSFSLTDRCPPAGPAQGSYTRTCPGSSCGSGSSTPPAAGPCCQVFLHISS